MKPKEHPPVGPFAPTLPKTAEREEAEPMAVARDKQTIHDAFMPTSASLDAFDPEVARRHGMRGRMRTKEDGETRRMQAPPGYTEADADGFSRPDEKRIEEEY